MKLFFTRSFEKDYERLPAVMQQHLDTQLMRLLQNPKHRSLNIKKIKGTESIWEGRVTRSYRFTLIRYGNHRQPTNLNGGDKVFFPKDGNHASQKRQ